MRLEDLPIAAKTIEANIEAAGFDESPTVRQVLALAEEVGEFVGAFRRWSGQARRSGSFEDVESELADVVITAFVTAEVLGIKLEQQISRKFDVIMNRGWRT